MTKPLLTVLLAGPRGFCAGVDRAVQMVERAIERHGTPVYVRHEIVHNRNVVAGLERRGAIFVEELDQVPPGAVVVFSAHGVPKSVSAEAGRRNLSYLDATCPLVSKVHREAERHFAAGRQIVMIGHHGHPEVIGTMGQLPDGAAILVETSAEAEAIVVCDPDAVAYVTQTTLSVDDTTAIIATLKRRFPRIAGPKQENICYATTNRQRAVKAIAPHCDLLTVIGAPNSSNSNRLVEVARRAGCGRAILVERAAALDWRLLDGVRCLGITAGASAPEALVQELIADCRRRFEVDLQEVTVTHEDVQFKLPRSLVA